MQQINSSDELRAAIIHLESKRALEGIMLKEQCHAVLDSLRPVNLIKNACQDVAESEEVQDQILGKSVGLATGYLSKILFERVTNVPLKKVLGTALMMGISTLVARHPETIRKVGNKIFSVIKGFSSDKVEEPETAA